MRSSIRGFVGLLCVLVVATSASAVPIVIDFGPLVSANETPYAGHVEDGFTVASTLGDWFEAQVFGNPVPSIFAGPIGSPSPSEITITGGLFRFLSADASSNSAAGTAVLIQGFLNNALVYSNTDTIGNVDTFNTIPSLNPGLTFDRLTILFRPPSGVTSANLDNIVLDRAIIPEPATLSLLGISALGLLARRRRAA